MKWRIAILILAMFGSIHLSTNAKANCEDACESGHDACANECPTTVHDDDSGGDFANTDANALCEDACEAGKDACESECDDEN